VKKLLAFSAVLLVFPVVTVFAALLEGTVQKVDQSKKQILLQTDKGQETVEFTRGTNGADKVKAGDKVKINYSEKSGKIVADAIEASKSSASPSPSERPTAPGGMPGGMKDAPPTGVR
jgi:hypothetical protein